MCNWQRQNFACQSKIVGLRLLFNDSTIKGLGPKILAQGPKFLHCYQKSVLPFGSKIPVPSDRVMPHFVISIEGAWDRHHRHDNHFFQISFV